MGIAPPARLLKRYHTGNYSFRYNNGGEIYQNNNGKITKIEYEPSDYHYYGSFRECNANNVELFSKDEKHSFYSGYEYEYVVIDGKRYGNSPAIQAWYEKDKNVFIWNAIEGKELVVYEYKLQ